MILARREAREVMLNYELIDESPSMTRRHRAIPDGGNRQRQRQSPQKAENESPERPFTY